MNQDNLVETVTNALKEDLGRRGDVSAGLMSESLRADAYVITRQAAVLCGRPWFDEVFRQLTGAVQIDWQHRDGDWLSAGECICRLHGPARTLLSGERTALNFMQTLSATATLTYHYRKALGASSTILLDTRKTIPGLRLAQKYAVRCGGGQNHRMGLYDAILIKENHIMACGGIGPAIAQAHKDNDAALSVEVEVECLEQLIEALQGGADKVLLDNFSRDLMVQAIVIRDQYAREVKLEASGGIHIDNIEAIAATGIDMISVGALTKDIQAVDLSMRFVLKASDS